MNRWLRFAIALVLIPACLGSTAALFRTISLSGKADTVWVALLVGLVCWVIVYLLLPRPMWIYVFGHELTHVLWAWAFGGQVRRFKVTSKGGHVVVSKDNFLISLSPYFFPIYSVAVVAIYSVGNLLWSWARYQVFFHFLLGATYAFHVTLTWHILQTRQSDITRYGTLFSANVIWLANALILLISISLLTESVGISTAFGWCISETGYILQKLGRLFT